MIWVYVIFDIGGRSWDTPHDCSWYVVLGLTGLVDLNEDQQH